MASSVLAPVTVDYPSSDGKPVGESDVHITALIYARGALRNYFRDRRDVYVAGNLLLYYEEGTRAAMVVPDVFVVLGAANRDRETYRLWEEPKAPDFVLEVTSRTTRREDQGRKRVLYRRLGVTEYLQYDPTGDYLHPELQGLRLVAGEYEPMPGRALADGTLVVSSAVLGLELRASGRGLRVHDPVRGKDLDSWEESHAARERAEQEQQQAEQERQREQQARERAEQGWQREQQARQRAERERQAAEARLAELEALLRRQRGDPSQGE
jgi:Uma2 family endonuclease